MEFIEFRGGPIVREDAVRLYLSLDARGHTLTAHHDELRISRGSDLTPADRAAIVQLKGFLIALANYTAPEETTHETA